MGKKYSEPTAYRDKRCPYCGLYFTPRGLNGHIRFYHEGYEKQEIKRLKSKLFNKLMGLSQRGYKELLPFANDLGTYSEISLDELHQLEALLEQYQ